MRFQGANGWRSLLAFAPLALVAGLGVVALRTTIVTRDVRGSLDFIVVGPPVAEIAIALGITILGILLVHTLLLRVPSLEELDGIRPGTYLSPLLTFLLPIAGLAAAMWGGAAAPPLVYWWWEWCAAAVFAIRSAVVQSGSLWSVGDALFQRVSPRTAYLAIGAAVAAWIIVSNPSLRTWRGPLGDEPRYLRYIESWCQGGGVDISRVARLSEVSRESGPRLVGAFWFGLRTLAADIRGLASDVVASVTDPAFRWDRMTSGDGSFVMGRGGGSYQSHQPGLSLILLPAYAIDRHVFSRSTVYVIAITASGTWAHWNPRFRHNEEQGRAPLVAAYVKAGDCSLCWSSRRGPLGAEALAANALESLKLEAQATRSQARFHLAASGPNGPVFGTVRFDFGDGQVGAPEVMAGSLDAVHQYRASGEYKVKAWLYLPGESPRMATATVRIGLESR